MIFIYDRSQADIENRTEKGYINASDLVRVESNTEQIAGHIAVPVSVNKVWNNGDLPRGSDFKRICDNVEQIGRAHV